MNYFFKIFGEQAFEHVTSFDTFRHVVHFFTTTHDIVSIRCVQDMDSITSCTFFDYLVRFQGIMWKVTIVKNKLYHKNEENVLTKELSR